MEEGGYQAKAAQLNLIGFWVPLAVADHRPAAARAGRRAAAAAAPAVAGRGHGAGRGGLGLVGGPDRGAWDQAAAVWSPAAPDLVVAGRPLGFEQVVDDEAGAGERADPVAGGAVVLGVDRRCRAPSTSTYGVRSKYDWVIRRPAGVGSSGMVQRIGWVTEKTSRPPGLSVRAISRSAASASATNGSAPKAEQAMSKVLSLNGIAVASAATVRTAVPVRAIELPRRPGAARRRCRRQRRRRPGRPASARTAPRRSRPRGSACRGPGRGAAPRPRRHLRDTR